MSKEYKYYALYNYDDLLLFEKYIKKKDVDIISKNHLIWNFDRNCTIFIYFSKIEGGYAWLIEGANIRFQLLDLSDTMSVKNYIRTLKLNRINE